MKNSRQNYCPANVRGLKQVDKEEAMAGDIVAITGFEDIHIGDTITNTQIPLNYRLWK